MKTVAFALCLWAGLFLNPKNVRANENEPFDTLRVALRYINNFNRNIHHDYWKPETGIEVGLASDFYLGNIELGATWVKYTKERAALPDYHSLYLFAGWGLKKQVVTKLNGTLSLRVGNHMMIFDDDSVEPEGRIESELAVELLSGLSFDLSHRTCLEISTRYRRVYTHHRLELAFIGIGLSRAIETPGWLKGILR